MASVFFAKAGVYKEPIKVFNNGDQKEISLILMILFKELF